MSGPARFDPREAIACKRDGGRLSEGQIEDFLCAFARDASLAPQAAALLMTVVLRGLDEGELVAWTRSMLNSGDRLELNGGGRPKVDKHSTGGVGDKASLPLAPALAACGACVPMISGRGLGHTGGTLDKLEAIPGLRTELDPPELQRCLDVGGYFIAAQTDRLVPADKRLYALRDATATVESIPLIASSIVSKKLAEGLEALVLDVKHGSGAFLPEPERASELAATMVRLCQGFGLAARANLHPMDRPLGRAIGHALEVRESIDCLRGEGPADLRELVVELGGDLLELSKLAPDLGAARRRIESVLDDGSALDVFRRGVEAQGGDPKFVSDPARSFERADVQILEAQQSGRLVFEDLREVGAAVTELGGGRVLPGDSIDFAVGLVWLAEPGSEVQAGQPLVEIHSRAGRGVEAARARLGRAGLYRFES